MVHVPLYAKANNESSVSVISTLTPMQNSSGGFGAGSGHLSHCAASYAAILALVMVGGDEALSLVNRKSM